MTHRLRRAPGVASLALKQVRADPGVSLLLAALVLVMAVLATVAPRALMQMNARQADYSFSALSVTQRDLSSTTQLVFSRYLVDGTEVRFPGPEVTWEPLSAGLAAQRLSQPEPLRSLLQPAAFYVDVGVPSAVPNDPQSDIAEIALHYRVDPNIKELVSLVEGDWPTPTVPYSDFDSEETVNPELEILLSQDAAEQVKWEIGEVRAGDVPTRLSGTYRVNDEADSHWAHSDYATELAVLDDLDRGLLADAAAYLAPGNPGVTAPGDTRQLTAWYPLDASTIAGDDVETLTAQLSGFTASSVPLVTANGSDAVVVEEPLEFEAQFSTELFSTLEELSGQQRATASIAAVVAAGPIGVALAVLALGAQLIVTRRVNALTLATARGGSALQLRALLAAEGLVIGLPAALLGYVIAGLFIAGPHPWTWGSIVAVLIIGLTPAFALGLVATPGSTRGARSELGGQRSKTRRVGEALIVGLAAIALWRLVTRGLTADGVGVDPLVAGTPALLALAIAVLTLRLMLAPLRAMTRWLHTRTGLAPFVGAARALRDPAGGLLPVTVVVLGVSVAVLSTVLASTISEGAQESAWNASGAQIRVSGPSMTDDVVDHLTAVPGVAEVARVSESRTELEAEGRQTPVTVYVVDDSLQTVHYAAPAVAALPQALYADSDLMPVVLGGSLEAAGEASLPNETAVEIVGQIDRMPGLSSDSQFLVTTRSAWEDSGRSASSGNVAWLAIDESSDPTQVSDAVSEAWPNSFVETPQEELQGLLDAPATSVLTTLLIAASALTTALAAVAIVVGQALGARSRARLLAILRTMGASRSQVRILASWEAAPGIVAAFVAGGLLGVVIPWVLLRAVDLRVLTGGVVQPDLAGNPLWLALVAGGVLATLTAAVLLSTAVAARTNLAQHLRLGGER